MKNKKALIILLVLILIITFIILIINTKRTNNLEKSNLLDFYDEVHQKDIKEIEEIKYTEGGSSSMFYKSENDINKIYNILNKTKLKNKTNKSCEDNTTVYKITLNNKKVINITFECDWVIIGKYKYLVK